MQRYRPFETKKKSVAGALIWAAGLALFAVVLFIGLMVLENHVVITEKGLYFDFSRREEPSEPLDMDFVQVPTLEIEEVQSEPEERYYPGRISSDAVYAMEFDLDFDFGKGFEKLWNYNVNTVILRLRPASGVVSYASKAEGAKDHTDGKNIDVAALIKGLHESGYRVYARISVYADATFAADNPASALKSIEREEGWLDNDGVAWVNPYSAAFNGYFSGLLAEYASFDFDAYLFENAAFPYAGKLSDTYYVDDSAAERAKEVNETAEAILAAIREKPVYYLLDVPTVLDEGINEITGVDVAAQLEKGIGVVPILTISSAGNLAFDLSKAGYCQTVSDDDLKAILEKSGETAGVLPLLTVRGKLSDTLRLSVEKAVETLRRASPGAYAVSLGADVYFPELFKVMGNEGDYLLGDVKTPPEPESEAESEDGETGTPPEETGEGGETTGEEEESSGDPDAGSGEEGEETPAG